jgi:DNA-binding NarL/FixJ family response regulator
MNAQPDSTLAVPASRALAGRPLRILVADDHRIVRDGLKQVLADRFPQACFGEAANGQEALDQLGRAQWDVMLLDLTMPGRGGLEVLSQLKAVQPETRALVLTMHPEDQYAVRVLKAGAVGYLTKETASEEVVNAILKVLEGENYVSASLTQSLVAGLNGAAQKPPHEALSDREYQILRLIALGKTVKEIAFDLSLSVKTVSTYRARVLRKLGLKTNADLVRYALREKLVE